MPSSNGTPSARPAAWSRSRRRGLQTSVRSVKRGPISSAFGPEERRPAGQVEVVGDDHQRPGAVGRVHAAGRVGQDHDRRAEPAEQQHRLDDQAGVVALVEVEPALEHDDRDATEPTEEQAADVAGRRRGRPAGQVRERDRDGVLEVVGQAAEPRAEHDADPRDEIGPGTDGGLERGQAGGLLGRRDGRARSTAGATGIGGAHGAEHTRRPRGVRGGRNRPA